VSQGIFQSMAEVGFWNRPSAMPVQLARRRADHHSLDGESKTLPTTLKKDDFAVATDLYYVNVDKQ
jgi:hypothetical protein